MNLIFGMTSYFKRERWKGRKRGREIERKSKDIQFTFFLFPFFVFDCLQGGTIKPLVRLLHIQMESKKTRHLTSEINETVIYFFPTSWFFSYYRQKSINESSFINLAWDQMIYHLTAGMEEICGKRGNNYIRVSPRDLFSYFSQWN